MSDLRTRIAAALQATDDAATPGADPYGELADAVISELEADYILVPRSHTLARKNFRYGEHYGI